MSLNSPTYLAGRAINLAMRLCKRGKVFDKDGKPLTFHQWSVWFSDYLTWDKADEKLTKIVSRLEAIEKASP